MTKTLLAASALVGTMLMGQAASAAPALSYYYYFGSDPTTTSGYTQFDPTVTGGTTISSGGESFNVQMSATGTTTLANYFNTNALSVSSVSGTGSNQELTLVVFESGLTNTSNTTMQVAYTNNGLSTTTVAEGLALINSASTTFIGTTPNVLSVSNPLTPGQTGTATANTGTLASTYGLAESYTAIYNTGNNLNATISAVASSPTAVPEPASLALLGAGMVGFSMIRRRRNTV